MDVPTGVHLAVGQDQKGSILGGGLPLMRCWESATGGPCQGKGWGTATAVDAAGFPFDTLLLRLPLLLLLLWLGTPSNFCRALSGFMAFVTGSAVDLPLNFCFGLLPSCSSPQELPLLPPKPLGATAKSIWLFGAAL